MKLLRDLGRRKLRTTLTILGITIGIWALVVFGSMANKINSIVDGGSTFYADKVTVAARGSGMGFSYSFGRGVGALFPTLVGFLSARLSLGTAIGAFAGLAYLLVLATVLALPETRGRSLEPGS